MKRGKSINQLAAWAQQEIAAQDRLLGLVKAQEEALRDGRTEEIERAGLALEAELLAGEGREARRLALIRSAGVAFGLPARTLTLGEVVRRAEASGEDTAPLRGLREELRARVVAVVMAGRRIGALARYHQDLLGELLRTVASPGAREGEGANGLLIDAEG